MITQYLLLNKAEGYIQIYNTLAEQLVDFVAVCMADGVAKRQIVVQ